MQAPSNLSPQQRHALESVYAFLSGASASLESIERNLLPVDEKPFVRNLRGWADLYRSRLIEAFPELLSWVEEWKCGGAA